MARFSLSALALMASFAHFTMAAAKDPQCKANGGVTLHENLMNPIGLKAYITQNRSQLKTVDDVICCLPLSYRKNFIFIHSSLSAQSSDVRRPRTLLFNPLNTKHVLQMNEDLNMVLSFNGGGDDLTNSDNIEILYHNPISKEAEFYDLDLSRGKMHMSGANPAQCMQCHGSGGQWEGFGAKPIFENVDQWTNVVNGVHTCEAEDQLGPQIVRTTRLGIASNTRYRCLDSSALREYLREDRNLPSSINALDVALRKKNGRRMAKYLRSTPDYEKYKYASLGSLLCFGDRERGTDETTENVNFEGWLPESVIKTITDTNAIRKDVLQSKDLVKFVDNQIQSDATKMLALNEQQKSAALALKKGELSPIRFHRGFLSVCHDLNDKGAKEKIKFRKTQVGPKTLDQYKADSLIRGFRGEKFNPFFRYLYEGRGLSLNEASMEPLSDQYPGSPSLEALALMQAETPESEIGKMFSALKDGKTTVPQLCDKLKELSMKAFEGASGDSLTRKEKMGVR